MKTQTNILRASLRGTECHVAAGEFGKMDRHVGGSHPQSNLEDLHSLVYSPNSIIKLNQKEATREV